MAPPERRRPASGERADLLKIEELGSNFDGIITTPSRRLLQAQRVRERVPADVHEDVRRAGWHLGSAQYRLDDHGFACLMLNDLRAETDALVAEWQGRRRPPEHEPVPAYIADAARAWRRQNGRSY